MGTEDFAKRLWAARREGREIALESADAGLSLSAAYHLQRDYIAVADSRLNGWKIGASNPEGQAALALDEPFAGPLFECFTRHAPTDFPISGDRPVIVEVEFVLRLGRDIVLDGEHCSPESIGEAVDAVCPALEIGGARLGALTESNAALLVADAAGNGGLVCGTPASASRLDGLENHLGVLLVNGEHIAQGTGADVLGHPLNALAWLVEHLARYGQSLHRGDLITTGTCTGINEATVGDEVVGDFGDLGRVEVKLTASN